VFDTLKDLEKKRGEVTNVPRRFGGVRQGRERGAHLGYVEVLHRREKRGEKKKKSETSRCWRFEVRISR